VKAVELFDVCVRSGIALGAEGERLHVSAPGGVLTPALRAALAQHKTELLALLRQQPMSSTPAAPPIRPVARIGDIPLSFAQEGIWFVDQLAPGGAAANSNVVMRLQGPLNLDALKWSFDELIRRHEALRTTFGLAQGRPIQVIAPAFNLELPIIPLESLPAAHKEAEVLRLAAEEAQQPFDLGCGPLLRTTLLRLAVDTYVLLLTIHHIISDGWSMGVISHEIATLYAAFIAGRPPPLPELAIQYADFAVWQRNQLNDTHLAPHIAYWTRQLADAPMLNLPTDQPRPSVMSFQGSHLPFVLNADLKSALLALTRRESVTLFMILLTAWKALLYAYTDQTDILVGTTVANRNQVEIEPLIGVFVNTLVMRTDLAGNPSLRELLGRVRDVALSAYEHAELPFELLAQKLRPGWDLHAAPLAQAGFVLQNMPMPALKLGDLTLDMIEVSTGATRADLILFVSEAPDRLHGAIEYNTDIFNLATIKRIQEQYAEVLRVMAANLETRLDALPVFLPGLPAQRAHLGPTDANPATAALLDSLSELTDEQVDALLRDLMQGDTIESGESSGGV
jgi:hypothetical protein